MEILNLTKETLPDFFQTYFKNLTTPDGENLFLVTNSIFDKLDKQDIQQLEEQLSSKSEYVFALKNLSLQDYRRGVLRFGNHFLPELYNKKTGLISCAPPDNIHSMVRQKIQCGDFYYCDLITESLNYIGEKIHEGKNYLDFGCSSARVVRTLNAAFPNANWYGCDPQEDAMNWAKNNFKNIKFYANKQNPPLDYNSSFFSGVFSISVWSHFTESACLNWFDEMYRIIVPNGYLVFTTHGMNTLKHYFEKNLKIKEDIINTIKNLLKSGYYFEDIFREQGDWGLDLKDWGQAYVLPNWICRILLKKWNLCYYQVGRASLDQDVYVLQKR